MHDLKIEHRRFGIDKSHNELARAIEGHINRVAGGGIRDLLVIYCDDKVILQGRSQTYLAKQLAQQAALDLTDGYPLLANQIVVSWGEGGPGDMPDGGIPSGCDEGAPRLPKNQGIQRHFPRDLLRR
jgi:hypothetical protein